MVLLEDLGVLNTIPVLQVRLINHRHKEPKEVKHQLQYTAHSGIRTSGLELNQNGGFLFLLS